MSLYGPSVTIPVYSVLAGVGIAITGVRFWVRTRFARIALGADDLFVVLGVIVAAACTAMQFYNAVHGSGGDVVDPSAHAKAIVATHKIDWVMIVIEKPAFGFVKLSILLFYRRLFGIWPGFRRINNVLIAILVAWTLSFTVADVLLCGTHPELNWALDQMVARRGCGDKGALLLAFAATSVATDVVLLVLPFFYLGNLQMTTQKKLSSGLVFFLGSATDTLFLQFHDSQYPAAYLPEYFSPFGTIDVRLLSTCWTKDTVGPTSLQSNVLGDGRAMAWDLGRKPAAVRSASTQPPSLPTTYQSIQADYIEGLIDTFDFGEENVSWQQFEWMNLIHGRYNT
ncbi:hypothetical protein PG989_007170 [Apiospora arundinis]